MLGGHGPLRSHLRLDVPGQLRTAAQVIGDDIRDVHPPREVPEPLKALQRQHQREQMLLRPRETPRPENLVTRRAHPRQLPGRHQAPEPRISRPLN